MTFIATIALLLAAASPAGSTLCSGVESKIEPDMRILESDLTQRAATQAAEKLRDIVKRDQLTGDFRFGALNQSKVVYGHILLRQAQSDRIEFGPDSQESRDSKDIFCKWLSSEGFWYD